MKPVVIVGAGHAGVQVAAALRDEKYPAPILLVGDEPHAPYQRPPLSKAYLKGTLGRDSLALRGATFYGNQSIKTNSATKSSVSIEQRSGSFSHRTVSATTGISFWRWVHRHGRRRSPAQISPVLSPYAISTTRICSSEN
jgi:NADH dehydrogenase FAD-containing subunit